MPCISYYTLAINMIVGQLPSSNLNLPRSLFVMQYQLGGSRSKKMRIPGNDNLAPKLSHNWHVVLQSNLLLLTLGHHSNTRTLK